jgi:DMSO/TMAO reductase YedYZ molybdopterin-dependent catalytic subunit
VFNGRVNPLLGDPTSPETDGTPASDVTSVPRRWRGLAGAVAAGLAVAVAEFLGGLAGLVTGSAVTLVGAVGDWFIDTIGRPLAAPAIDALGGWSKPLLVVGIVAVCLVLGALVGVASDRRRHLAALAFGAAGLAGAAAAIGVEGASVAGAVVAAGGGAISGWWALGWLLRVGTGQSALPMTTTRSLIAEPMTQVGTTRRRFLGFAGLTAAVGVIAAVAGRALQGSSVAETARSSVRLPAATTTPGVSRIGAAGTEFTTPGLSPLITPNADFYRIDTALVLPDVNPTDWSLTIDGMVDRPVTITFDELLAMPMVEEVVTLACVSNPVGGSLVGTAVWQGVPLATLLAQAGVQPTAQQLVGRSVDGFTVGFPVEAATDGRVALVAVGMNGEPLPVRHGFPARLVVAGLYGYVSATKWLRQIELTTWDAFDPYWIPRGWAREAPVRTQSRIDVPTNGSTVRPGPVPIAGVAWAPDTGIERVEVRVDDGPWVPAQLSEPLSNDAWRQWVLTWDAAPGLHTIRVRATDRTGFTQPEGPRPVAPDGAEGWHTRRVTVAD